MCVYAMCDVCDVCVCDVWHVRSDVVMGVCMQEGQVQANTYHNPIRKPDVQLPTPTHTSTLHTTLTHPLIPPTPHPHIHTHTSHHTHTSPLIPPTPHSPMHTYPDVNRHIHTLVGLPLNDGLSYCILKMEEPLCEVVAVK